MRKHLNLTFLAAVAAVAGCKSNDPAVPFCNAFPSQGTVTETCMANCTIDSTTGGREVDGDLDTAVEFTGTSGTTNDTAKFRVGGSTVASGATVGVFVTEPNEATLPITRTIRTYSAGGTHLEQTVTGTGPSGLTLTRTGGGTKAVAYVGFKTTASFDTMEYQVSLTYPSNVTPTPSKVYELCSDGGASGG